MPHDKVKVAARERMAWSGESYTAARRAVIAEHEARQTAGEKAVFPASGRIEVTQNEHSDAIAAVLVSGTNCMPIRLPDSPRR